MSFEYQENWGEQTDKACSPRLFLLDLKTQKITKISKGNENLSVSDVQFCPDGKGCVFVGYLEQPVRLGIKYYNTRSDFSKRLTF